MREPTHDVPQEANWEKLRPLLDTAMHGLKESDRDAILLRYFENRPYAEVGAKFGLNENAARLRVERALEKLRALLAKQGLTAGTTLASILSAHAIQTAPGSLAANLAHACVTGAVVGKSAPLTAASKMRLAFGTLVMVGVMTTLILHHNSRKASAVENQIASQTSVDIPNQKADPTTPLAESPTSLQTTIAEPRQNELLKLSAAPASPDTNDSPELKESTVTTNQSPDGPVDVIQLNYWAAAVPAAQMPKLSSDWAPAGNGSVLSSRQYEQMSNAVPESGGLRFAGGGLMTGSGYPAETAHPVILNNTNVDIGMTVGATPSFDSSVFTVNILTQLSPLYGVPSQPGIHPLQISNQFHLFPGQSAVLETAIPQGYWLKNALSLSEGQYKLLIFFKPTTMPGKVIWKIPFHHVDPKSNSFSYGTSPFE